MRRSITLSLCTVALATTAAAQTVVDITDASLVGGQTYNWTKNNTYVVNGLTYLETGGKLNIEAGTVIKFRAAPDGVASADNTSALFITKGAQIFADGTAAEPIIFTAEADDVNNADDLLDPTKNRGLWGGLVLLGNGTVATAGSVGQVEGISGQEPRGSYGGGTSPNDTESSGRLKYVSIRHAGKILTTDNELNGLTLAGVGSGTEIDYIEIFANDDDGIEFFGGTVDVKHAVIAFCADDAFDYDTGWRGRGQFWFAINRPEIGGRSGEHDGAIPDGQEPFSNPTIANATFIGGGIGGDIGNDKNDFTFVLRDAGAMKYYNSVFTDYPNLFIDLEDLETAKGVDSYQRLLNGDVQFKGNILGAFGTTGATPLNDLILKYPNGDDPSGANTLALIQTGNRYVGNERILTGISRDEDRGLDPRPSFGSALLDASTLAAIPTAAAGTGNFFTNTSYAGAFSGEGDLWMRGWTALDFYGVLTDKTSSAEEPVVANTVRLSPNPTSAGTYVDFNVETSASVTISVLDIQGRRISSQVASLGLGAQRSFISTAGLPAGSYIVRLVAGEQVVSKLLLVAGGE